MTSPYDPPAPESTQFRILSPGTPFPYCVDLFSVQ